MARFDRRIAAAVIFVSLAACASVEPSPPTAAFTPYEFVARDGTKVAAERGAITVPENRSDPSSRMIELGFVRFRATGEKPGAPIVYLAGGPGGSGVETARGRRFPLFMAMREFGDVIAFDQRGTGWSNAIPKCVSTQTFPLDEPLRVDLAEAKLEAASDECAAFWKQQGVDIAGYNSLESARDIDALRRALGARKVALWGISYGSHLAFAAMKVMPWRIDRAVLAGIEGPNDTVKLPARTDAYFARVQEAIDADPGARAVYPDLAGMMRRVHARLDAAPIETTFDDGAGGTVTMTFGKLEMQAVASFSIADPSSVARLPAIYAMADAGDVSRVAPFIYSNLRRDPITFDGMPEAMDIMSGISDARIALVREQAKTALLGDVLNFPMPYLIGGFGLGDLGDAFRAPVSSNVPTLVLTSTLDGRTYPEAAADVMRGLPNGRQVIVENGGHNVFMQSPRITEIIQQFMRGEQVPESVTLEPPKFVY